MKHIYTLIEKVTDRLDGLARGNAVVSKTISVGDKHVIPLCELSLGFGAGGGSGEGTDSSGKGSGQGQGGGSGAGIKATPLAVVVVDGSQVRIELLQR